MTTLLRPLLFGVVTGLRSQLGLAVLAWAAPPGGKDPRPLRLVRSGLGRAALTAAAAGELVADKLPATPSRLRPPVLTARLVTGAGAGLLAAAGADRRGAVLSAAAGVLGAGAGSWAGARYRQALPGRTGTGDLPWALVEDAAAAALAVGALRAPTPTTR